MASARLMVLISHDLKSLAEMCTSVAWLERGRIRMLGPLADVIAAYREGMARLVPVGRCGMSVAGKSFGRGRCKPNTAPCRLQSCPNDKRKKA